MSLTEYLTSESTTVECKESLNSAKPKSWLKTISAFANTDGGVLIVGVSDKGELLGVENIQKETARAAEVINAHIEPVPRYHLSPVHEEGKDYLVIQIPKGTATPYYYSSNGTRIPYIRLGDESITDGKILLKGQSEKTLWMIKNTKEIFLLSWKMLSSLSRTIRKNHGE